jgi:hypothetical protein
MPNADDDLGDSRKDCHQSELGPARQSGVVTRDQLYELGFSYWQINRRLGLGRLHRIHHNVFAVGHRHLTDRAHLFAALLTFGPEAFLSHRTAAAVWKLRAINLHGIEVTLPGSGGRHRDGLTVHRTATAPEADEVRTHGDLRVSSVPRMLIELAARETSRELDRLVTLAVQKRLLRPDSRDGRATLEQALARHERHPGTAKLAAVLAVYRRTESRKSQLEVAALHRLPR